MLCSTFGVFWVEKLVNLDFFTLCLERLSANQAPIDFFSEKPL